jgi:Adenylate cyclase, family 3 (some proteins contain HAMP domain)
MVGNLGTRELFNYTAVGDTVNLCQRLEVAAQPDQLLIDRATYSALADQSVADPLEPILVKGKARPTPPIFFLSPAIPGEPNMD